MRRSRPLSYVLDEHRQLVPCDDDPVRFSLWLHNYEARKVGEVDYPDGSRLSTACIGCDTSMHGPPLIFETAHCDKEGNWRVVDRYDTWENAAAGHSAYAYALASGQQVEP